MDRRVLALCVFAVFAFAARGGEIYKWTDAQGQVHYSQTPPDDAPVQVVPIQPSPERAKAMPAKPTEQQPTQSSRPPTEAAPGVPPEGPSGRLGPLPENQVSEYLRTLATLVGIQANQRPPQFRFSITLRVRADVPVGAVLVASFEDPGTAGHFLGAKARVVMTSGYPQKIEDEILLQSPTFTEVRCRNYAVVIRLYQDPTSGTPMGTHRQLIQSRLDSRLLRANPDWMTPFQRAGQVCP
jgi:hypothetical protein